MFVRLQTKLSVIALLSVLGFACTSSSTSSTQEAISIDSPYSFTGISTIDRITGDSMRLNWPKVDQASKYYIYNVTTGTPVFVASLDASQTSYKISGLTPATQYVFRVRMIDKDGNKDTNLNDIAVKTLEIAATHHGWTMAKALGGRTPVAHATGLSTTSASVTLGWYQMTISSSAISGYNVYRATTPGGQDFTTPLATGIAANTPTYTDNSVTPGTTYYYVVRPAIYAVDYPTSAVDSEIKITVPPVNMSLVHRWIANAEICTLMGRSIDRENDYRCHYIGPTNVNGFFDLGKSLFFDTVELGCNYTPPNATASLSCNDSTNGCIGNGVPAAVVADGQVFYSRQNGNCYLRTGGNWLAASTLPASLLNQVASNSPGLPPLVMINQIQSWNACQAFTESTFGTKRLPTRREYLIAAAWDTSLTDAQMVALENGSSLPTTGNCNSNNGNGLTFSAGAIPANIETLPSSTAGTMRSVRTGSNSTQNCLSIYGIQDLVGNVTEWSSDQITNCSSASNTCQGVTSSIDPNNTDWNGIAFDGTMGPGGGAVALLNWTFNSMSNNTTRFLVPLGLPIVSSASSNFDTLTIGSSAGMFDPARFHTDSFWIDTGVNGTHGSRIGGSFQNTTSSGRYALILHSLFTDSFVVNGARCVVPAE